jgi:hypothetical protein
LKLKIAEQGEVDQLRGSTGIDQPKSMILADNSMNGPRLVRSDFKYASPVT